MINEVGKYSELVGEEVGLVLPLWNLPSTARGGSGLVMRAVNAYSRWAGKRPPERGAMLALGSQSAWLIKRHGQRTFGLGSVVASFSLDEIEVVAGQPSPLDIIVKFNGEELFGPGQYLREIKAYLARR